MPRFRHGFTVAAAALLAAALPALAWAQEEPTHEGMPQLNFANPLTLAQAVWMFVIFLALYLLLAKWALPQVAEVVEHRTASITADLNVARESKAQADAAAAELVETTRKAHAEAQNSIAAAIADIQRQAAHEAHEANNRLDSQLAEAERRIDAARTAAMGALRQVAADSAALLVDRLTGQRPDQARVDAAVTGVLAARPS